MNAVLVLGGAGFIGSHLVEEHLRRGDQVLVLDTLRYCFQHNLSLAKSAYRDNLRVEVEDVGVSHWEIPKPFGGQDHWDYIYHLAGVVATPQFVEEPWNAFVTTIRPLEKMLYYKAARRPQCKMLFASSSEVYGSLASNPRMLLREDHPGLLACFGPRCGYDLGKAAGEAMIYAFNQEDLARNVGTHIAIVRIFNTFGPRMTAALRMVPSMIHDALVYQKIRVFEPGTQTRTFLYVDDCVRALMAAIDVQYPKPINVGGVTTTTAENAAELLADLLYPDVNVEIEMVPGTPHDVRYRKPDIRLAKEVLDWEPQVRFRDGLIKTIEYWRDLIDRWLSSVDERLLPPYYER